ncbi:MAG TPA: hypothetical protein VFE05_01945 [Longimicrobiaceae bacterium]|jgi:hypothetical protein|nr:hypothetical protein [Longimicrobiaceae bacterium]
MFARSTLRTASAAVFLALAGCSSPTSGSDARSGTLSFDYAGVAAGHYSASGALRVNEPSALTYENVAGGGGGVSAAHPTSRTRSDAIALKFAMGTVTGTVAISETCNPNEAYCGRGEFDIAVPLDGQSAPDHKVFLFTAGSVTVTERSISRVKGTFSGTAYLYPDRAQTITVTNGRFDAPFPPASY